MSIKKGCPISLAQPSHSAWNHRRDWIACLALAALIVGAFAPLLIGGRTLADSAASTSSLYPTGSRQPAAGDIHVYRVIDPGAPAWQTEPEFSLEHRIVFGEHALPLWNPYSGYGMPLMANMQSQPLSPMAWPIVASDNALGYDFWIVFRFVVGAVLMFAYCRCFFGRIAAFCGGLSYGFCGYFVIYFAVPEISVLACAPALFLAIERYTRSRSWAAFLGVSVSVALIVLGGMPESACLIFLLALIYAVARLARSGLAVPNALRTILEMGAASLVGFGCCAVLLFSFIEYLGQAQTSHDGQSMVGLQSDPFSLRTLASYIVPLLQGPPYNDIFTGFSGAVGLRGYFGPVASVLALAAVIDWTGRRANVRGFPRILYALVSIVLLLKRFGVPGPQSLGTLPVLNQITMDKYDEAIIAFCVAALVAYSIEAFARRAAFVGPLIFAAAAVLGVLTAVLADRALIPGQVAERLAYFDGSLYLALAFIAGLLATSLFRGHTRRSGVGAVFVLASLVIASSFTSYFVPLYYLVDRSAALSESALLGAPYIAALKNVLADGRRVFSPDHVLFPDWSAAFGIEDVRALDALYDYRYTPFLTAFRNGRAFPDMIFTGAPDTDFAAAAVKQWLALSAVGAIVTETKLPTGDYTLAYSDSSVKIYRVRKSLPMISAFSSVSYVASGAQALAAISNPHFDPLTTLVVEADPRTMPRFATPASIAPGTIRRLTSSTILAEIDARYPSMLLNDATNYPGWHAFVDGKATPILSADYLFQAIVVPAGKHVVEFRYEPASVAVGGVVSVVSLIAMLGVAIIAGVRRYA